jgi:hypothetical protein
VTASESLDAHTAWIAAASLDALLLAGILGGLVIFPAPLLSALTLLRLVQAAFCIVWLLVLARERRQPRLGVALAAFGCTPLPLLVQNAVLAMAKEAAGAPFEPFLRQRVIVLIVAALTPRQVGGALLLIAAFSLETCAELWIRGWGASRAFSAHEPWVTLGIALSAVWIARVRAHQLSREQRLQAQLREAMVAAEVAHVAVAVLDLANTPLQVIELQLTLLEEGHPRALPEAGPIRRALDRLRQLSRILASYQAHPAEHGAAAALTSFDAGTVLLSGRAGNRSAP